MLHAFQGLPTVIFQTQRITEVTVEKIVIAKSMQVVRAADLLPGIDECQAAARNLLY